MASSYVPPPTPDLQFDFSSETEEAHPSRAMRRLERQLDESIPPTGGAPIAVELENSFSDDVAMNILFRHLAEADAEPGLRPPAPGGSPQLATNLGVGVNAPVGGANGINLNVEVMGSLPGHPASNMADVGTGAPAPAPAPGDTREPPVAPLTPPLMNAVRNLGHRVLPGVVDAPAPAPPATTVPASLDEQIRRARRQMGTTDSSDR